METSELSSSTPIPSSDDINYMASDYIQFILFVLFLIIGLPVNISTLVYMLRRYRHAKSFLLLLHINLNISDILVLGVYVPGLLGWLYTYQWTAGPVLCKIARFIDAFVFAISSNIMVCIALYRLYALRYPCWISAVGHSRVPRMLIAAWGIALITMIPQLFIWRQRTFGHVTQCMTVWTDIIHTNNAKINETENVAGGQPSAYLSESALWWMNFYSIQNVAIIFYIPLVILIFCYVLILKDIYSTLNMDPEGSSALYMSEISKLSTCSRLRGTIKKQESSVCLTTRPVRGQDKFRRVKVRSLKITLLLILTYVITWLPYNLLSWWMVMSLDSYSRLQDIHYFLNSLVVLNSVINPFIYGRCQGVRLICFCENEMNKKPKKICKLLRG